MSDDAMKEPFEIMAKFTDWLKLLPYMEERGIKRHTYSVKGVNITYFTMK